MERELMRVEEAADMLSISRAKLYQLIAQGEMPGVLKIGRSTRIPTAVIRAKSEHAALSP
jgi:excisionase family DNA binding protein